MRHLQSSRATDDFADFLINCFILSGAAATFAYLLILFLRLPVFSWYGFFPLCLALAVILRKRAGRMPLPRTLVRPPILALLLICLLSAAINAVTMRPNADDYSYLHRALHAAGHLDEPIAIHHTGHDIADLPPISPMHLLSSVEVGTALTAKLAGLPITAFIHQGLGALTLFLVPLAYYRLFRALRFRCWAAIGGTMGAMLFLALIGGYWGHFTLTRAWQGKCILVAVGLPLLATATLRSMLHPQKKSAFELQALTLFCVGLSSSAFFLVPYTSGLLACTVCLVAKNRRRHIFRLLRVSRLLIPLVAIMALSLSPILPQTHNMAVWRSSKDSIYEIIGKVGPSWGERLMYLGLAVFSFYAARKRTPQRIFALYAPLSTFLLITPGIGWILMKITTPAVYWRLAFTSLAPALAGLPLAHSLGAAPKRLPAAIMSCALLGFLLLIHSPHTLYMRALVPPHGEKFSSDSIFESDAIGAKLPTRGVVLAPMEIAWVLGLRYPELRMVVTRPTETGHIFNNYPDQEEAKRRRFLSFYLQRGPDKGDPLVLLSPYLDKIDGLVLPGAYPAEPINHLLSTDASQWGYEDIRGKWRFWYKKAP